MSRKKISLNNLVWGILGNLLTSVVAIIIPKAVYCKLWFRSEWTSILNSSNICLPCLAGSWSGRCLRGGVVWPDWSRRT